MTGYTGDMKEFELLGMFMSCHASIYTAVHHKCLVEWENSNRESITICSIHAEIMNYGRTTSEEMLDAFMDVDHRNLNGYDCLFPCNLDFSIPYRSNWFHCVSFLYKKCSAYKLAKFYSFQPRKYINQLQWQMWVSIESWGTTK